MSYPRQTLAEKIAAYNEMFPPPPPPPRTVPLLTRDEVVTLLRARGYDDAADRLAEDKAGPPFIRYLGERRYEWLDAYEWGRDWRMPLPDYASMEDDEPPPEAGRTSSAAAAIPAN